MRYNLLLIIVVILVLPAMAFAQQSPEPPKAFTIFDWPKFLKSYQELYYSTSAETRCQTEELINNVFSRLIKSDIKFAAEIMESELDVFNNEKDESVISATNRTLSRFITYSQYSDWVKQNYKKTIIREPAKIRFLDLLAHHARTYRFGNDTILPLVMDFLAKEETFAVRGYCMKILAENFTSKSIDILLDLVKDPDINISKEALSLLAKLKIWEKLDRLIQLLREDSRKEIKEAIGRVLEKTTGQSFKTDSNAWKRWLDRNPLGSNLPQNEVDSAIYQGSDYLINQLTLQYSRGATYTMETELIFYTLLKSGTKIPDELMGKMLNLMLEEPLERTYNTALQAIALTELDKVKYIGRIAQCAEFLLANQNVSGSWSYGVPVVKYINTSVTATPPDDKGSTKSVKKIKIKIPPRRAEINYDNSNTQYALLGLKACAEANLEIPEKSWADAEKHFLRTQLSDGGWMYSGGGSSYGSMTAGGLGALAICKYYLNREIKGDQNILKAVNWLAKNFTVYENPKYNSWHYYYLYGLERAGILADFKLFGTNEWYPLGARFLLREQREDGSWGGLNQDTCFAILFLRKATQPLKIVITGGEKKD